MTRKFTVGLLLMFSAITAGAQTATLSELDTLIQHRENYEKPRRAVIARGWAEYHDATDAQERYNVLRGLYENYRNYRIDSALIVADMRLAAARVTGDRSKTASATMNLAEAYVRSGLADKAIALLDTIPAEVLKDYHKKYLRSIYGTAYGLKAETAVLATERREANEMLQRYRDDSADELNSDSRGFYTLEAERLRDEGLYDQAVAKMEEANRRFDFSDNAALLYTMGEMYYLAGQNEKAIDCLARSAVIDITDGSKEYRSLILLASILFEEGQVERAFNYINCAFDDASFSGATIRTPEIMKSMPVIYSAYTLAQQEMTRRTQRFLIFAVILAVGLLLALFLAYKAFCEKKKMVAKIEEFNRQLEHQNSALAKADALKLENINALMLANAAYIARLKEFRRDIKRLLKASQYEKALQEVTSARSEAKDIATFHEMFDKSFLSIFPDFVDEINRVMKTPVELKQSDRLTPELRIAAMMKLGLTSTDDIAAMLQYNPQTVYNLRSTLRNMVKVSREEFETYLSSR